MTDYCPLELINYIKMMIDRYGENPQETAVMHMRQDVMTTVGRLTEKVNSADPFSIRRAISEFQSIFKKECSLQSLDNAVSSMADRKSYGIIVKVKVFSRSNGYQSENIMVLKVVFLGE